MGCFTRLRCRRRLSRTAPSANEAGSHSIPQQEFKQQINELPSSVAQHAQSSSSTNDSVRSASERLPQREVKEDLPPGWQRANDPNTGHDYFYCCATRQTQWTCPSAWDTPMQQHARPNASHRSNRLPPIESSGSSALVRAARQYRQEHEDRQLAIAMQNSLQDEGSLHRSQPRVALAIDPAIDVAARAAAARAAIARASNGPDRHLTCAAPGLPPLALIRSGSGGATLPPVEMRQTKAYSRAFRDAVEERLNEWSTQKYSQASFLQDVGRTLREQQRDCIQEELYAEWTAARQPVYEVSYERRFGAEYGQRLGSS